jgi:hypothetical protein
MFSDDIRRHRVVFQAFVTGSEASRTRPPIPQPDMALRPAGRSARDLAVNNWAHIDGLSGCAYEVQGYEIVPSPVTRPIMHYACPATLFSGARRG